MAGQPNADGIAWLKSMGIKTVLNLRHYHGDSEKQLVESAGLRYERIALASSDMPRSEQVARFLEIVRDPSLRPLYVHCQHGVDRTGAMMAVYRMEEEGWSNPEAFAEMEFFDAHLIWQDLRNFVRAYRPGRGRRGWSSRADRRRRLGPTGAEPARCLDRRCWPLRSRRGPPLTRLPLPCRRI